MTKEFREGERDKRPEEKTDEFEELRDRIKERYKESSKEGVEDRSRVSKDDDPVDHTREKVSAHPDSAEGSSETAAENHAEQPEVKNKIKQGDVGQLEAKDEGGRDEELGRLKEQVKERHESEADEEKHDVDQETGILGNGPVEEPSQEDVREEPKALSERLSRESEAPQNPEPKGRGDRVEENPTNPVLGDDDREGQPPVQDVELDRPLPKQNPSAQPDVIDESKGQVDSSAVSEGSEPSRMVQAGGVRFEVGDFKPPVEEELLQDGIPVNPQRPEIGVVPRHGHESQLSQQSSVRTGSLDSRVTEGDSRAFRGAALGSAGKETESKVQRAEGGPPKEGEPRLSNAEGDAQNLISRRLIDLEATADFYVELGNARAFQHGHIPKDGSGSHDDASLARKESLDTTSAICAKAYRADLDYPSIVRLEILRTGIEERTGVRMERDKLYHIKGTVEGIYGFEVYQASRPSIRLHVPAEYRDRVEAGKIYNVTIKSINEVPLTDAQREILLWSKKGTRWKAVLERSSQVK